MFVLLVQYIKLNLYCVTQLIGLFRWKHLFLMWVSWASTWSRLEWVWAERRCREFFLLSSSLLSHSCCCNADYGAKFWEQKTAILLLKLLLKGTTIASMNQLKKRSERLILRRMRWGSKKCGIENELDMLVIKSSKKKHIPTFYTDVTLLCLCMSSAPLQRKLHLLLIPGTSLLCFPQQSTSSILGSSITITVLDNSESY